MERDAALLLCFSILAGETITCCCGAGAEWQVTSPERAAVAGHRRLGWPPAQLRSRQVLLSAHSGASPTPGISASGSSSGRGASSQPGNLCGRPEVLPLEPGWKITSQLKCKLVSRLQLIILMPADIVPCEKKCEGLFLQDITCFANKPLWRSFGDPRRMFWECKKCCAGFTLSSPLTFLSGTT